ncbi:hypothetical protein VD0002_g3403 [Verticillium dahliae]|uniref:Uncharacterized protein n=1 Tax=Verticillium dahliae TaxID=27337 RepID=A0AA45AMG7_VERDA|nr:hypothetical protein BJF96_g4145 [Verticillium dahliae]PNH39681.1 hypothetical protein VD0004_g7233 [Verticillium dahliae]PNH50494.1 hypothetical protein VD0003_g6698 [Verticillium dahliae]PNH65696.1 hypothetical protein VD0002_g3403 [Verticillium dahliae]PNH69282.1 hypothetical protein VD0001_g7232 [Verticillium dahliae]
MTLVSAPSAVIALAHYLWQCQCAYSNTLPAKVARLASGQAPSAT